MSVPLHSRPRPCLQLSSRLSRTPTKPRWRRTATSCTRLSMVLLDSSVAWARGPRRVEGSSAARARPWCVSSHVGVLPPPFYSSRCETRALHCMTASRVLGLCVPRVQVGKPLRGFSVGRQNASQSTVERQATYNGPTSDRFSHLSRTVDATASGRNATNTVLDDTEIISTFLAVLCVKKIAEQVCEVSVAGAGAWVVASAPDSTVCVCIACVCMNPLPPRGNISPTSLKPKPCVSSRSSGIRLRTQVLCRQRYPREPVLLLPKRCVRGCL